MYYVRENDKPSKLYQFFINMFNKIKVEGYQIEIPKISQLNSMSEKKRNKKVKKIADEIAKIVEKSGSREIVLTKKLKQEEMLKNNLYSKNIDIINGEFLFSILAQESIQYMIDRLKIDEKDIKIAVLVNDVNDIIIGNIIDFIQEYKNITIVTRHIQRFKRLQNDLYNNDGIVLAVTNNKRKSISKTNIILNFDFPEELLNKYTICENANIINFSNKVTIYKKRFNGVNISDYEIDLDYEKQKQFGDISENYIKDVYEANILKNQNYRELRKKLKEDGVMIKYLVGRNTIYN